VSDWVERYRRFWEQRFDNLDGYLKKLQMQERKHVRTKRSK
jgi:predicted N-acyltransferase